jgi:signal transduction histidine kinase
VDVAVAAVLTAGAIADVARLEAQYVLASVLALICTGTVAWRRRAPAAAAVVALTAMLAYQLLTSDPRMSFEPFAVLLASYMLGRRAPPRHPWAIWALFLGYALAAFAVVFQHSGGNWVAAAGGAWVLFAALPIAFGRLVAWNSALGQELAVQTERLRRDQELRAREAANVERYRLARELHDVVAHCVSVMVIQASAARVVAAEDAEAARAALRIVETCGREAMVELRRMVGAVHRGDESFAAETPGLAQLADLAERARQAGVPTRMRIDPLLPRLTAGLELAVYRIVQEALTNVVKHAGGAAASVEINARDGMLELTVTDSGTRHAAAVPGPLPGSGNGLVGVRERVALYRGQASARPDPDGGWALRARIPLAPAVSAPEVDDRRQTIVNPPPRRPRRRTDRVLAAVWLVALEVEVLTSEHRAGSLVVNALLVASMALAFAWRRRSPLLFVVVVGVLSVPLTHGLTSRDYATLTGLYAVLVPMYTVAAWEGRARAVAGLALWAIPATAIGIFENASLAGLAGPLFAASAAWTVGRVIRGHRSTVASLRETSERLAAEHEDRARLAAVGERVRIAGDLQRVTAQDVIAMIVESETAASLLEHDTGAAIKAIAATEARGRRALTDVRLILGVLRNRGIDHELEPQPGLAQIHALVEQARQKGQPVRLVIEGEPGSGYAGVELTAYRILEELLDQTADQRGNELAITLQFEEESLRIDLSGTGFDAPQWPNAAIRERVAFCNGKVERAPRDSRGTRLVLRLPRSAHTAVT